VEEGGDDVDKKLVESSNQPVAIIDNSLFLYVLCCIAGLSLVGA
jgi:hypothetical protein